MRFVFYLGLRKKKLWLADIPTGKGLVFWFFFGLMVHELWNDWLVIWTIALDSKEELKNSLLALTVVHLTSFTNINKYL